MVDVDERERTTSSKQFRLGVWLSVASLVVAPVAFFLAMGTLALSAVLPVGLGVAGVWLLVGSRHDVDAWALVLAATPGLLGVLAGVFLLIRAYGGWFG